MADRRDNAVATAQAYHQGNIAGLDDAMTRRLVASTVMTESNGGNLTITNKQGYVGRYQAGAGWLADAGYIDQDKLKAAMHGYKSEWAWASSGHMTEFLNDPGNWKNGLSLEKYKASAELQDDAFKINSDKAYHQAIKRGVLHEGDDPAKIAGFLKARHIAGPGGAEAAITGGRVIRDSNGTSNYDYMHDITRNRDGLDQRMNQALKSPAQPHVSSAAHPAQAGTSADNLLKQGANNQTIHDLQTTLAKLGYKDGHGHPLKADGHFGINTRHAVELFQHDHHLTVDGIAGPKTLAALHAQTQAAAKAASPGLDDPRNPDHKLYEQALAGVRKLDAQAGRASDQHSANLAAVLVVAAKKEGITRIDDVALSTDNGASVFAVQHSAVPKYVQVPTLPALNTPLEQSSNAAQQVSPPQAQSPMPAPTQRAPTPLSI